MKDRCVLLLEVGCEEARKYESLYSVLQNREVFSLIVGYIIKGFFTGLRVWVLGGELEQNLYALLLSLYSEELTASPLDIGHRVESHKIPCLVCASLRV